MLSFVLVTYYQDSRTSRDMSQVDQNKINEHRGLHTT